jgi:hypothetical protein
LFTTVYSTTDLQQRMFEKKLICPKASFLLMGIELKHQDLKSTPYS